MTNTEISMCMTTQEVYEFSILNEKLDRIESQLTEMHSIFCQLYEAYEAMSNSPMFAALVGRLGK